MSTVPGRGGVPLSVTVTTKLSVPLKPDAGVYVASPLAVTVAVPLAGGVLMLKVCVWPASGSFGLTRLVPGVFCGVLMPGAVGTGARFGGAWTVTGMSTVPGRGGVPLSVTVTTKLSVPLKPDAGVYVASPLAVTVAVPLAGGVLMLKVCVWPASGSFGLTRLVPGVFCGVLMPGAVGTGARFGGGGGAWMVTGMVTVPRRGGVPLSVAVTTKLSVPLKPDAGVYVASPLAVTVAVPLAGGVLMLKVCVWPASGSFGLTRLVPGVFCGVLMPGAVGTGARFGGGGGAWMVTGMVTVPGRGGVPLSVTVTTKLSAPLKPVAGVYVASPLAVTVAVPLAGGVLMLKVCVWPASGSFGLTRLVPGVFCRVVMLRAVGIGGRFGGAWTVTGMSTVPERGGVPLSVTVTTKLLAPLKPVAGVYVASPLADTVAVPLAGGIPMLNVCVWPASGSLTPI